MQRRRYSMVWVVPGALLAALLWHSWYTPDIWTHLFLGKRILETGSPQPRDQLLLHQPSYLNVYWLFQLLLWGAYRLGGVALVTLCFLSVWFVTFGLWSRSSRVFERPWIGFPLTLLCILVCQTRFEERPETLSWVFLALQIALWARWRGADPADPDPGVSLSGRHWALLAVTQVFWTNVHGYFFLGPAVAALRLAAFLVTTRRSWQAARAARRSLIAAPLVLLLCSLISPFGFRAWSWVWELGRVAKGMRFAIEELQPPLGAYLSLWTIQLYWIYAVLTALVVARALVVRRQELFASLLAITGLVLSASSLRYLPLAVLFAGPAWGSVVLELGRARAPRFERVSTRACALLALALVPWTVQGGLYRSLRSSARFGLEPYGHVAARAFVDYVDATGFCGTVFNDPSDGGYLQLHAPGLRVYGDSRFAEPAAVLEYFAARVDPTRFQVLDARYRFDAVLVDLAHGQEPLLQLLTLPSWRLAYADLHRALLVRTASAPGRAASAWPPRFYSGEDLSVRQEGVSANRWTFALAHLEQDGLLLELLRQLASAPRVPSPVIAQALEYGLRDGKGEIVAAAAALAPRAIALNPGDRRVLDEWLGLVKKGA